MKRHLGQQPEWINIQARCGYTYVFCYGNVDFNVISIEIDTNIIFSLNKSPIFKLEPYQNDRMTASKTNHSICAGGGRWAQSFTSNEFAVKM